MGPSDLIHLPFKLSSATMDHSSTSLCSPSRMVLVAHLLNFFYFLGDFSSALSSWDRAFKGPERAFLLRHDRNEPMHTKGVIAGTTVMDWKKSGITVRGQMVLHTQKVGVPRSDTKGVFFTWSGFTLTQPLNSSLHRLVCIWACQL